MLIQWSYRSNEQRNWPIVTDKPAEFDMQPVEIQDVTKITNLIEKSMKDVDM